MTAIQSSARGYVAELEEKQMRVVDSVIYRATCPGCGTETTWIDYRGGNKLDGGKTHTVVHCSC